MQTPGRAALAFRLTLVERTSAVPVVQAQVRLAVARASGASLGSYRMSGFGGVYSLLVPIPSADGWRSLRYTLEVVGPLGTVEARYAPPSLLHEWLFDPVVLALGALAAALVLHGFVRLRRRGRADRASVGRLALFGLGLCLLVGPLVSPLDPVGDGYLLSAHMLQHLLIGDAAPALILLSLRGPLLFFALPARLLRLLARSQGVRAAAAFLVRPSVAVALWALAYGGWHVPVAYDAAATHPALHDVEHATFVLAGVLLWTVLLDPAGHRRLTKGRRLGVAASVFALGTVISDVLIFSLRPLYPLYSGQPERVFGLSPVHDQQLAGLVMTIEQILTLGTFAAVMVVPLLLGRRRRQLLAGAQRLA